MKFSKYLPALEYKEYRQFWLSQFGSLVGTWMQRMGQSWLVYTMTNSPLKLGIVNALQFLPMLFLGWFAGSIIDRFSKRHILFVAQIISALLALILFFLVIFNVATYYHVVILAFLLGVVNAIDMPCRQAMMMEMVGRKHLSNALALNSASFNSARIVGPAISGLIMAHIGTAFCFLINTLSFIPIILVLGKIKNNGPKMEKVTSNIFSESKEGIKYILTNKIIFQLLFLVLIMGVFSFNFAVLLPVVASAQYIVSGEIGFGYLMSSLGVGALIGALAISFYSERFQNYTSLIAIASAISVLLVVMGLRVSFYQMAFLLLLVGVFGAWFSTISNSLIQMNAQDRYRGRVMSIYSMVWAGATPFGNYFTGYITEHLSYKYAFVLTGLIVMAFLVFMYFAHKYRFLWWKESTKVTEAVEENLFLECK